MGVTGGDRCRRCDHYECCGGPQFGCYPSFPEYWDEEAEGDEDDTEPERDRERR